MSTILRAINDNGVKYDLDILEEVPFRLDISAIESGNIGQVYGVSSQKLTLPPLSFIALSIVDILYSRSYFVSVFKFCSISK